MAYQLQSRLPQIIEKSTAGARAANAASAARIARDATARAPAIVRRNGTLEVKAADGTDSMVTAAGWARSFGHWWEWGSVKIAARPFLTPAAEAERAAHRKAIAELYR